MDAIVLLCFLEAQLAVVLAVYAIVSNRQQHFDTFEAPEEEQEKGDYRTTPETRSYQELEQKFQDLMAN